MPSHAQTTIIAAPLTLLIAAAPQRSLQFDPPGTAPPIVAPDVALAIAVDQLRAEGAEFRRTGTLKRTASDFAQSFDYELRHRDLFKALAKVHDEADPVVDAYIRWQLLSFEPDLSTLSTTQYVALVTHLPRLLAHPARDPVVHREFERLADSAARNVSARNELQQRWETIQRKTEDIELLNQPAFEFHEMIIDRFKSHGPRHIGALLQTLFVRINAGWDTRSIKTQITKLLRKSMTGDAFTLDERWQLTKYVDQLDGPETKIIRDVVIYASAPAHISYSTLTVRSTDIKNWTAYLNRHEP